MQTKNKIIIYYCDDDDDDFSGEKTILFTKDNEKKVHKMFVYMM